MNAKNALEGIERNVGDVSHNIDLVMAANTQESQEHNNNKYKLCVDSYNIAKKGALNMPNIDIENNVEQDTWDYLNEYNKWEGGGIRNNDEPKQNRMLENFVCNDRIRNDEVANILLSFNRKNKLDNSCNNEDKKNSEEENKGDQYDQFEANLNKSGHELGEGNDCVAEKCGVDDCEGELEENSKATFDINYHECNVITDTEDSIGIVFKLEGNDVKVSMRDFGSYVKFNKECLCKGYKCGTENTYLSAQLFAAPAAGQKWHRLKCMNVTGRYENKKVEGKQLSFLNSIRNEIQKNGITPT
jgi:hypothetical protein